MTSVTRSHGNKPMTYKLNVKKALDKKIEATDGVRSCNIEFKGGTSTLVIICNVGAYRILKSSIDEYYDQSKDWIYRPYTKTRKSNLQDVNKQPSIMIVEESVPVKK